MRPLEMKVMEKTFYSHVPNEIVEYYKEILAKVYIPVLPEGIATDAPYSFLLSLFFLTYSLKNNSVLNELLIEHKGDTPSFFIDAISFEDDAPLLAHCLWFVDYLFQYRSIPYSVSSKNYQKYHDGFFTFLSDCSLLQHLNYTLKKPSTNYNPFPTMLLDWTEDLEQAKYFAMKYNDKGVVYSINTEIFSDLRFPTAIIENDTYFNTKYAFQFLNNKIERDSRLIAPAKIIESIAENGGNEEALVFFLEKMRDSGISDDISITITEDAESGGAIVGFNITGTKDIDELFDIMQSIQQNSIMELNPDFFMGNGVLSGDGNDKHLFQGYFLHHRSELAKHNQNMLNQKGFTIIWPWAYSPQELLNNELGKLLKFKEICV